MSCVDEAWVQVLHLDTEPVTKITHHEVTGSIVSEKSARFVLWIGGKAIEVRASVVPRLPSGILVGMNTLQKYACWANGRSGAEKAAI